METKRLFIGGLYSDITEVDLRFVALNALNNGLICLT